MPDVQYFTGTKEPISSAAAPVRYFLTAGFVPALVRLPLEQESLILLVELRLPEEEAGGQ